MRQLPGGQPAQAGSPPTMGGPPIVVGTGVALTGSGDAA